MTIRQRQLLRQHDCSPLGTFLLPILTQIPLFLGGSVILSHLSRSPSPFDSESFLTLTSLSHVDPTSTFPIVLGCLTLANVESSSWFMTEAQRHRKAIADAKFDKSVEAGEINLEWGRVVKSGLRFASVARVLIASMVPGVSRPVDDPCSYPHISPR
jgi:mitochondrial inner membrane protein COX18